jgi:hypothetical protein
VLDDPVFGMGALPIISKKQIKLNGLQIVIYTIIRTNHPVKGKKIVYAIY